MSTRNQTRKVYSFVSSGVVVNDDPVVTSRTPAKPPIGIKTPLQISPGDGLFEMHTDISKQISDNLRNLLLTNHGERLGFFDFGANLRPILFDLGTDVGDAEAISRIKSSVMKYMPFVSLQQFQVFVDRRDNKEVAKVGIQITYTIPRINEALRSLEVMLYMGG
tara:strand:- start:391 stop:882 length:492 start_codon:yes stop_codon:yes gene_type:complete